MKLTQLLDTLCMRCIKQDADDVDVQIYNSRQSIYYHIKNITVDDYDNIEIEVV